MRPVSCHSVCLQSAFPWLTQLEVLILLKSHNGLLDTHPGPAGSQTLEGIAVTGGPISVCGWGPPPDFLIP